MRLAAYAGVSVSLAAGVVLRAFNERPNFYSATVYLAQSNACRLILLNVALLSVGTFMVGLQRLLYGPLRPIEIEQLWDKAWYAITETALAMTVFRDEVGGWFFVMFVSLLSGKVWSWISEGRVEILEQQPPTNPRLFHTRLTASLLLSELFDIFMLRYCVYTLLEQPKPGMMVMFAFEFAVLFITSTSTTLRYALSLREALVIKQQTKAKIEERREEMRAARHEAQRQAATEESSDVDHTAQSDEDEEIDENEIDVPGWQEKGRWILLLDLTTDFLKLVVYICFFVILLIFHGIPIHILRDVLVTTRSFLKRIVDFLKYRSATKDMNERYPDATAEELARDGTCIICREEMRIWQQPDQQQRPARQSTDERQRPKKLPCGHILHFGCLRSWLERQQVCPTCRSPVLVPNRRPAQQGPGNAHGGQAQAPNGQNFQQGNRAPPQNDVRARVWNLGPWRLAFAAGNQHQVQNALQRARNQNNPGPQANQRLEDVLAAMRQRQANTSSAQAAAQLANVEQQIMQEINALNAAREQLERVQQLQTELERLRAVQANQGQAAQPQQGQPQQAQPTQPLPAGINHGPHLGGPVPNVVPPFQPPPSGMATGVSQHPILTSIPGRVLGSGHPDLPAGLTLPEGWSLMPLARRGDARRPPMPEDQQNLGPVPEIVPQQRPDPTSYHAHRPRTARDPSRTGQQTQTTTAVPRETLFDSNRTRTGQAPGTFAQGQNGIPDWSNSGFRVTDDAAAQGGEASDSNKVAAEGSGESPAAIQANGHATAPQTTGDSRSEDEASSGDE